MLGRGGSPFHLLSTIVLEHLILHLHVGVGWHHTSCSGQNTPRRVEIYVCQAANRQADNILTKLADPVSRWFWYRRPRSRCQRQQRWSFSFAVCFASATGDPQTRIPYTWERGEPYSCGAPETSRAHRQTEAHRSRKRSSCLVLPCTSPVLRGPW